MTRSLRSWGELSWQFEREAKSFCGELNSIYQDGEGGRAFGGGLQTIGVTPFQWTVLGLRLSFLFAESFRS